MPACVNIQVNKQIIIQQNAFRPFHSGSPAYISSQSEMACMTISLLTVSQFFTLAIIRQLFASLLSRRGIPLAAFYQRFQRVFVKHLPRTAHTAKLGHDVFFRLFPGETIHIVIHRNTLTQVQATNPVSKPNRPQKPCT